MATDFPPTIELCHARLTTARQKFAEIQADLAHWKGKAGELRALLFLQEAIVTAVRRIVRGDGCERPPDDPLIAEVDEMASLAARAATNGRLADTRYELLSQLSHLITKLPTSPQQLAESIGDKMEWGKILSLVRSEIEEPRSIE